MSDLEPTNERGKPIDARRLDSVAAHNEEVLSEVGNSRNRLFSLIIAVATPMDTSEEVVEFFCEKFSDPGDQFALVHSFAREKKAPIARQVFDHLFERVSLDTLSDKSLNRLFAAAVLCAHSEAAQTSLDLLLSRVQGSPDDTLPEVCSCLHTLAQDNQLAAASAGWRRLHTLLPGNQRVKKMHQSFLEQHPSEESEHDLHQSFAVATDYKLTDRKILLHTIAKNPRSRFQLLEYCNQDFTMIRDANTEYYWMNMTRLLADTLQDPIAANGVWEIILTHAPERARAFLKFSDSYNTMGQDSEIDELIRWAHKLVHSTPDASTLILGNSIQIEGESKLATEWIQLLNEQLLGSTAHCAPIALTLLRHDTRFSQKLIALLQQTASHNPQHFLTVVRELAVDQMFVNSVLGSVVLRLSDDCLVDQTFKLLLEVSPPGSNICTLMTTYYIKTEQFDKIAAIWGGIRSENATACAHFAMQMLRLGQADIATTLFREVARVSPSECLRFGYQFFCQPEAGDIVCHCIESLLPTGSEKSIAPHSLFALRLLHRHGGQTRARGIMNELRRNDVISEIEMNRILSASMTPSQLERRADAGDQDDDIEAYLESNMPTLKRSRFFRAIMNGEAQLHAGNRTDSTAISVVVLPYRMRNPAKP